MSSSAHGTLANGGWHQLSLREQLGNIGSEVSRALRARSAGNTDRMRGAVDRALALFDLTLSDPKLRGRTREICRAREVVCDFFCGGNLYQSDGSSLDRYFTVYAMAARLDREKRIASADATVATTRVSREPA